MRSVVMLFALLVSVTPRVAQAQQAQQAQQARETRLWYEAYDEGVKSVEGGDWQAGIASLEAAKRLRPQQARRVSFYGDRVEAYIPDYYLGVAYLNLRRFPESQAAFDRVKQGGLVVQGDRTFQAFQTQTAAATTGAALARADTAKTPDSPARGTPPPQVAGNAPAVQPSPAATPPAAAPPAAASPVAAPPAVAVNKGDGPGTLSPDSVVVPDLRGTSQQAARARLQNAPLPKGPVPPPTTGLTEREAITAFFSGDYDVAAQALQTLVGTAGVRAPRASARARLYFASSLAALVLTGARDRSELDTARQQLAQAGSVSPTDERLISPRILLALRGQQ